MKFFNLIITLVLFQIYKAQAGVSGFSVENKGASIKILAIKSNGFKQVIRLVPGHVMMIYGRSENPKKINVEFKENGKKTIKEQSLWISYTIEDNNVINLTYCMDPDHLITIDPLLHNMSSLIEINEKEFVVSIVEVSIDS